ncbi:MAG TPA: putative glycoside hydrolase [Streptosporangiaceae bacterium]|jgi:hypothetical protein
MTAANGRRPGIFGALRRVMRLAVVAGLAAGLMAACTSQAPASFLPATSPRFSGGVPVKTFSLMLDTARVQATTRAQWREIARANRLVVLNSWEYRLIPLLRHANPRLQVWVYKNLSGVRSDDCSTFNGECGGCPAGVRDAAHLSSGMGYCWVRRHHPQWLLRAAATGRPLEFRGYPHIWETDYGSAAYQRRWLANVLADVGRHGWDGVLVDNALSTADAFGVAAKYPTDAAVQAATYSALRYLGPALRQAGTGSVFNVGFAPMFRGLWERWLRPVEGLEQEFYLSYSAVPDVVGDRAWGTYQQELLSCAAHRKSCWFHTGDYSGGVTSQTRQYALASYLLANDGHQLWAAGTTGQKPPGPALALGAPKGGMRHLGRAWGRYFPGGVAVVNPSSTRLRVGLGGTYLDDGRPVAAITLGPASGAVLRAAAAGRLPSAERPPR